MRKGFLDIPGHSGIVREADILARNGVRLYSEERIIEDAKQYYPSS